MTSMTNRTSRSHPGPAVTATTSTTSRSTVSTRFTQRPNVEMESPKHKTLNNALVTTNEIVNRICKYSVNHAPSHTSHRKKNCKGFPGALVHQVFAVFISNIPRYSTSTNSYKRQNTRQKEDHQEVRKWKNFPPYNQAKTNTTRRNDHTITSSLQQRVTHHHKVQDILRKPV